MKVAILGNQARAMSNFWTVLIRRLVRSGHDVLCIIPHEPGGSSSQPPEGNRAEKGGAFWEEKLVSLGVRIAHYPLERKGLNPLRDLATLFALRRILAREQPDRLFAFTIKPVIYGSIAAALAGHPSRQSRFCMVTGLGYMFEGGSFVKRVLMQVARGLYRLAFSCVGGVFFQNEDDVALFRRLSILPRTMQVHMSRGCGVDTDFFAEQPRAHAPPVFLYVGRLLEAKGLRDFAAAARKVKAKYPEVSFHILGPAEQGPGAVPLEEVLGWQAEGSVEYLGVTDDVRPYIAVATAVVLPSWREGTPTSLMEAMSCGRAVIAADAPGSREVVRNGSNGFLVPIGDAGALANAVESFILEPELAVRMGVAGRELSCHEFRAENVAAGLLRQMAIPDRE